MTVADVERYSELRRRGTGWPDGRDTGAVRPRSVAQDLALLRTMVRWAITVREPDGEWLLAENPLRGMKLPVEPSPVRPVATHDRFLSVRAAIQKLSSEAETEIVRARWIRLELALVLAETTGRRLGAIAGLRWADVKLGAPSITWRAEFDKRRREQEIPIPTELAEELRSFRARLGAFGGGWLFPQLTKDRPWDRKVFDRLLREAEGAAKTPDGEPLEPLKGGLWHAYRRKWATERKHLPAVDVMAAGGWKSRQTMETCYQQATDAGVLEVMASPVKLRERKASAKA
ncbi:MAG TPA: site-specific integrase [Gemmatimonadaceae bacterium]|nr:site-specific integrase [Gemmatimonadaceae bacterium]